MTDVTVTKHGETVATLDKPAHELTLLELRDLSKKPDQLRADQKAFLASLEETTSPEGTIALLRSHRALVMLDSDKGADEARALAELAEAKRIGHALYSRVTIAAAYFARLHVGNAAQVAREFGWVAEGAGSQSREQWRGSKAVNRMANRYAADLKAKALLKADGKSTALTDTQRAQLRTLAESVNSESSLTDAKIVAALTVPEIGEGSEPKASTSTRRSDAAIILDAIAALKKRVSGPVSLTESEVASISARMAELNSAWSERVAAIGKSA